MLFIILGGTGIAFYGFTIGAADPVNNSGFAFGGGVLLVLAWLTFFLLHFVENNNY